MRNVQRERFDCFLSNEQEVTWFFRKHNSFFSDEEDNKYIYGGDLVYLKFSENKTLLTADYCYQGTDSQECYLRKYEGPYEQDTNSVSSIWEIEKEDNNMRGDHVSILDKQ